MGLDMYLTRHTYVSSLDEHSITLVGKGLEHIKPERIRYIIEDVGYWRKANAIHHWFVKNVQDGEDDCKDYYVERETLSELLGLVNEVLSDHSKASELLPTRSGFFFGSTGYDSYYFDDLEDTKRIIESVLEEEEHGSIYYSSSW